MQTHDQRLIDDLLAGDLAAWRRVDQWISRAATPFRTRLGVQWIDAMQDIRLELLRQLRSGSFRGQSSLKTYLWRVANHTCIDYLRRSRRWKLVPLDGVPELPAPDPEGPMGQAERQDALRLTLEVLQQVSEECRRLWRWILDGESYQDMSARLGVTEGALRVRVYRCRKGAVAARRQLLETNAVTSRAGGA